MDPKYFSPEKRVSGMSTYSEKITKHRQSSEDNESLAEYMIRNISARSSMSSSTNGKKFYKNKIPQFMLEHIDDETLVLKHSSHSFEIEITSFELCENSSLLESGKSDFLYFEYTFLDHKGHLLESQSLQKPKRVGDVTHYRFSKTFEINPAENEKQFKILKGMLEKNSKNPIKFLLVTEPIGSSDQSSEECEEIG
jgi:Retinitis pigmentosa G-protein regulator interacting C-terminal